MAMAALGRLFALPRGSFSPVRQLQQWQVPAVCHIRQCSQAPAAAAVKQYSRPERMRDRALHNAGKGVVWSGVIFLGLTTAIWFGVIERQRQRFLNYYKTVDAEKVFFRQRQAGVFQSCRPLKEDDPEFWMGTYRGSKGSESREDFLAFLKRFPKLEVKVLSD